MRRPGYWNPLYAAAVGAVLGMAYTVVSPFGGRDGLEGLMPVAPLLSGAVVGAILGAVVAWARNWLS